MVYSITADLMTVNKRRMLMGLSDLEIEKEEEEEEQSHLYVAEKKICRWTTLKVKFVHSETFFLQQIFILISAPLRASFNNKSSLLHASFSCGPFSSYKTRRNYSRTL